MAPVSLDLGGRPIMPCDATPGTPHARRKKRKSEWWRQMHDTNLDDVAPGRQAVRELPMVQEVNEEDDDPKAEQMRQKKSEWWRQSHSRNSDDVASGRQAASELSMVQEVNEEDNYPSAEQMRQTKSDWWRQIRHTNFNDVAPGRQVVGELSLVREVNEEGDGPKAERMRRKSEWWRQIRHENYDDVALGRQAASGLAMVQEVSVEDDEDQEWDSKDYPDLVSSRSTGVTNLTSQLSTVCGEHDDGDWDDVSLLVRGISTGSSGASTRSTVIASLTTSSEDVNDRDPDVVASTICSPSQESTSPRVEDVDDRDPGSAASTISSPSQESTSPRVEEDVAAPLCGSAPSAQVPEPEEDVAAPLCGSAPAALAPEPEAEQGPSARAEEEPTPSAELPDPFSISSLMAPVIVHAWRVCEVSLSPCLFAFH